MELDTTTRRVTRRWYRPAVAALAAAASLAAPAATAGAATPLPTPAPVVASQVTAQSFRLNVGGATAKLYSVYLDGRLVISAATSSSTIAIPVNGLTQDTAYTVTVRQILLPSGRTSAPSAPLVVRTPVYVAPERPAPPSAVQAVSVTADTANLTWAPSPTPGVTYVLYLNGEARPTFDAATSGSVGPVQGYPSPLPGTGLRAGRSNRVGVAAVDALGRTSPIAEITVVAPGTAVPAPTPPADLRVTSVRNDAIGLAWSPSISPEADPYVAYRYRVDGVTGSFTCSQYCFGATGGLLGRLAPGTTYRIGVEALSASGVVSDIAEIWATTAAP